MGGGPSLPVGVPGQRQELFWTESGQQHGVWRRWANLLIWEVKSDRNSSSVSSFLLLPKSLLQFPINNSIILKDSWRVLNLREIPEAQ